MVDRRSMKFLLALVRLTPDGPFVSTELWLKTCYVDQKQQLNVWAKPKKLPHPKSTFKNDKYVEVGLNAVQQRKELAIISLSVSPSCTKTNNNVQFQFAKTVLLGMSISDVIIAYLYCCSVAVLVSWSFDIFRRLKLNIIVRFVHGGETNGERRYYCEYFALL